MPRNNSLSIPVFGLGTLIFAGLEIAMHATMEKSCVEDILIAHPILQALFTFLQMHFLFVNSQVSLRTQYFVFISVFIFADHYVLWRNNTCGKCSRSYGPMRLRFNHFSALLIVVIMLDPK